MSEENLQLTSPPVLEFPYKRQSTFGVFWKALTNSSEISKDLTQAQSCIKQLEADKQATKKLLLSLEKAIIELGNSDKASKTIRHELLALLDKGSKEAHL